MSKRWRTGVEAEITCKQCVLSVQRPPRPWANDQDKILKWVGQVCYWGGFCKERSSRIQCVTSHYHFMSNSQIQESIKLRRRKMFLWSSWFCSLIVTLAHTACASCGSGQTWPLTSLSVTGARDKSRWDTKITGTGHWDEAVVGGLVSNQPLSDCNGHNDQETEC